MYLNTILAIIIVLLNIIFFCIWVIGLGIFIYAGEFDQAFLWVALGGIIYFGFWGTVAYRLFNDCPCPSSEIKEP